MNSLDAVILGIVEGLTEFLPVSSTGHLILAGHLLGQHGELAKTFDVFIQLGAILAIVVLYWRRFISLFNFKESKGFSGFNGWILLAITSFPAALIGLLTHDLIQTYLFGPMTVLWALVVGGLMLIVIERVKLPVVVKSIDEMTWRQALFVGLFQCLALWPGMSRSGSTIVGGMICGISRQVAAEYSFIAAVPLMLMATTYDLLKSIDQMTPADFSTFGIGFAVAFVSAIAAVVFFVRLLQKTSLTPFGIYRILVAGLFYWFILR